MPGRWDGSEQMSAGHRLTSNRVHRSFAEVCPADVIGSQSMSAGHRLTRNRVHRSSAQVCPADGIGNELMSAGHRLTRNRVHRSSAQVCPADGIGRRPIYLQDDTNPTTDEHIAASAAQDSVAVATLCSLWQEPRSCSQP